MWELIIITAGVLIGLVIYKKYSNKKIVQVAEQKAESAIDQAVDKVKKL
jgi:hypothetical protein